MPFPSGRISREFIIDFNRHRFKCDWCGEDASSTSREARFCQKSPCQVEYRARKKAKETERLKNRKR